MDYYLTERGFWRTKPIAGQYGGELQVYESSGNTPCIWLKVEDTKLDEDDGAGETILLTLDQARELAEALTELADNHFLVGSDG